MKRAASRKMVAPLPRSSWKMATRSPRIYLSTGESLVGDCGETPKQQFTVNLSPHVADGKLMPDIHDHPAGLCRNKRLPPLGEATVPGSMPKQKVTSLGQSHRPGQ